MIKLELPMPPPLSALTANVGRSYDGKRRGRAKTKRYQTWIRAALNEGMVQRNDPIRGAYTMVILLPRKRRHPLADASNYIKAPEDLCKQLGLIDDDRKAESVGAAWSRHVEKCTVYAWKFTAEREAGWPKGWSADGPLFNGKAA